MAETFRTLRYEQLGGCHQKIMQRSRRARAPRATMERLTRRLSLSVGVTKSSRLTTCIRCTDSSYLICSPVVVLSRFNCSAPCVNSSVLSASPSYAGKASSSAFLF